MAIAATKEQLSWLCERTGAALTDAARGVAAVDADGVTRGVVAFDLWSHNSAHAHVALDAPVAARPLLRAAFEYAFCQADKGVLIGMVSADNERALKLDQSLGFREVARVRDGRAVGVDLVILELRREDCRFLKEDACQTTKHGKP